MRLHDLPTALDALTYPLTAAELEAALEGAAIDYDVGGEPLGTLITRSGADVVRSADDAWLAVAGALDEAAVGRKGYTDRDPPTSAREFDAVSF